ncbi:MAG: hypothetical protein SGI71_13220 [Verrucomicrobiota bacterium]|nr:hypothetical protein [Verrucomicrobiota bacterium]
MIRKSIVGIFALILLSLSTYVTMSFAAEKTKNTINIVNVTKTVPSPVIDGNIAEWSALEKYTLTSGEIIVGNVSTGHDTKNLFLIFEVPDLTPMMNRGQDPNNHFKEGDCVDLMLGSSRSNPAVPEKGDLRLIITPTGDKPTVYLYRQVAPGVDKDFQVEFRSPVRTIFFDQVVDVSDKVEAKFAKTETGYTCEVKVPFTVLDFPYSAGKKAVGDLGILSSNPGGLFTERRCYFFNKKANVTADLPTEAELTPAEWGIVEFE